MVRVISVVVLLSVGVVLATTIPADAKLIADIDAARNTPRSAFGILNCDGPGSISVVTDESRGKVWRFHKPADSSRCEAHGFKVNGSMFATRNNATYCSAWSSRMSTVVDTNAVFHDAGAGNVELPSADTDQVAAADPVRRWQHPSRGPRSRRPRSRRGRDGQQCLSIQGLYRRRRPALCHPGRARIRFGSAAKGAQRLT